jgi:hypothetical protein
VGEENTDRHDLAVSTIRAACGGGRDNVTRAIRAQPPFQIERRPFHDGNLSPRAGLN